MKIELIKGDKEKGDDEFIGYNIIAETYEDNLRLGSIRNMTFWGTTSAGTVMKYNGMEAEPEYSNRVKQLSWIQLKHKT